MVYIKRGLGEIVEFDGCSKGYMRIIKPQVRGLKYARREIVVDILQGA